jgi:hypothetical protein
MAIPWGRRDRQTQRETRERERERERERGAGGGEDAQKFDLKREWVGACEKRREDGACSLTDGTTPTAARVNMRCGFWRDLSPIGAKWALFPGLTLALGNGLREEIAYLWPLQFALRQVCSSASKSSLLLPTFFPGKGALVRAPPDSRTLEILIFLLPLLLLSRRHFGTNVSPSFHLLTLTFLSWTGYNFFYVGWVSKGKGHGH